MLPEERSWESLQKQVKEMMADHTQGSWGSLQKRMVKDQKVGCLYKTTWYDCKRYWERIQKKFADLQKTSRM